MNKSLILKIAIGSGLSATVAGLVGVYGLSQGDLTSTLWFLVGGMLGLFSALSVVVGAFYPSTSVSIEQDANGNSYTRKISNS